MGVMGDILPIDSRLFFNLLGLHSLLVIIPSRMNGYVSFVSPRKTPWDPPSSIEYSDGVWLNPKPQ
jgi:hypothetical protein